MHVVMKFAALKTPLPLKPKASLCKQDKLLTERCDHFLKPQHISSTEVANQRVFLLLPSFEEKMYRTYVLCLLYPANDKPDPSETICNLMQTLSIGIAGEAGTCNPMQTPSIGITGEAGTYRKGTLCRGC
jgi:hypothetical protein